VSDNKKPCVVKHKRIYDDNFIFITYFCGKKQRCFKQEDDKDSYVEMPENAAEIARNHGACCKCVQAIEVVSSKM